MASVLRDNVWQSTIAGKVYNFAYEHLEGSNHRLIVNGEIIDIKVGFIRAWLNLGEKFTFDGRKAILSTSDKRPDVAYNGTFLRSGKPYKPRLKWWQTGQ